eukprot:Sspe_Gene.103372::Locus_79185_Transcript_1_1_Confidence_1.000_Length_1348::g.103372::m.103372
MGAMAWSLLVATFACYAVAKDCHDEFYDNSQGRRDKFFVGCIAPSAYVLLDAGNTSQPSETVPSGNACFDTCLKMALQPDRSQHPSIQVVWEEERKACSCYHGGEIIGSLVKNRRWCSEPRWQTLWDVSMKCVNLNDDSCHDLRDVCEWSRTTDCCYIKGTVDHQPLFFSKTYNYLLWAVMILAALPMLQFIFAFWYRRLVPEEQDGDLTEEMLPKTSIEYQTFLSGLPTVELDPGSTGTACSICLVDLAAHPNDEEVQDIPDARCIELPDCKHKFHISCITSFATHELSKKNRRPACPNCRVRIMPYASDCASPDRDAEGPSGIHITLPDPVPNPMAPPADRDRASSSPPLA